MQEDQKGCKKNNICAKEEQITAARAKQHEDEEEDTGIRSPKKNKKNVRAEEEQTTAARTKQHEGGEEDTGTRPAEREK